MGKKSHEELKMLKKTTLSNEYKRMKDSRDALSEKVEKMEKFQLELLKEVKELKAKMRVERAADIFYDAKEAVSKQNTETLPEEHREFQEEDICRFDLLESNVQRIDSKVEGFTEVVEDIHLTMTRFDNDLDVIFERLVETDQYPRRNSMVVGGLKNIPKDRSEKI